MSEQPDTRDAKDAKGHEMADGRDRVYDALRAHGLAMRVYGRHSEEAADAERSLVQAKLKLEAGQRGGEPM